MNNQYYTAGNHFQQAGSLLDQIPGSGEAMSNGLGSAPLKAHPTPQMQQPAMAPMQQMPQQTAAPAYYGAPHGTPVQNQPPLMQVDASGGGQGRSTPNTSSPEQGSYQTAPQAMPNSVPEQSGSGKVTTNLRDKLAFGRFNTAREKFQSAVDRFTDRVADTLIRRGTVAHGDSAQPNVQANNAQPVSQPNFQANVQANVQASNNQAPNPQPVHLPQAEVQNQSIEPQIADTSIPSVMAPPLVPVESQEMTSPVYSGAVYSENTKVQTAEVTAQPSAESRQVVFSRPAPQTMEGWRDVVANLSIDAPVGVLQFETCPGPVEGFPGKGPVVEINGRVGDAPFRAIAEPSVVESLLLANDPELSHFTENEQDLALLLEYVCRDLIERVEKSLKAPIEITSAHLKQEVEPQEWLFLRCEINENVIHAGIVVSASLQDELARFVANSHKPEERAISKMLRVMVGPVSLPLKEAIHTTTGDILDCGANPNEDVLGILLRSDGQYWPVRIEDNAVVIAGEMKSPLSPSDAEEILACFELGNITLAPHLRRNFVDGAQIGMERLPNGQVNVWFGNRLHGSGSLDVIENSLCVELTDMGN